MIAPPDDVLQRRVEQQAAVAELGRAALAGAGVDDLLSQAVEAVRTGLGADLVAVLLVDESGEVLSCRRNAGWTVDMIRPVPLGGVSQIAASFATGSPVLVEDLRADERWPASQHLLDYGIVSGICVPITAAGQSFGVLAAHARTPRSFGEDDVLFLTGAANVLASTLRAAEAERARADAAERATFLAEASLALASSLDVEATLGQVAALAVPRFADWCVVHLVRDDRLYPVAIQHVDPLQVRAAWDSQPDEPDETLSPSGPGKVARTGEPELTPVITDELIDAIPDADRREAVRSAGLHSAMVVPLPARSRIVGTLTLIGTRPGLIYTDDDLAFAVDLGRRAGVAIDNARLVQARERSLELATRLQRVSSALARAVGEDDVHAMLLEEGAEACGAEYALLAVAVDGEAQVVADRGYGERIADWQRFPLADEYPVGRAVLARAGVYLATRAERDEQFPSMIGLGPEGSHAMVALPLLAGDEALGALVLSFPDEHVFDEEERLFLETLAGQGAHALDRARLYEARNLERERLRALLEHLPSGVILADRDGRLVLGNPQVERIWGQPVLADASTGDYSGYRGFHADGSPYGPEEWPILRALRHGETVVNEDVIALADDGTRTVVRVSAAPIRGEDDEIAAAVLVLHDVTAEVEARESAERRADAAAALAFVADGICLLDTDGTVRLWNEAAARITGASAEDVLARLIDEAVPGWATLAPQIPVAPAGLEPPRPLTLPVELAGQERWLSISGVRFHGGSVLAFRDVTEEHALDALKSDFIATVSHELRTPLSAVYGAAATLRTRSTLEPDEREQFLVMIEEQAERLSRIVNEILTASRLDSGEISVALTRVNGVGVAEEVLEMVRRGVGAGFELRLAADAGAPDVVADADRLRQVLANLVENAVKYSGASRRVEVAVAPVAGRRVRFAICDHGIGIAPAERSRIFEKFYRVDPAMNSGVSGTGLGLYIVHELVARMGGTVRLDETAGGGSTFVVELPAAL